MCNNVKQADSKHELPTCYRRITDEINKFTIHYDELSQLPVTKKNNRFWLLLTVTRGMTRFTVVEIILVTLMGNSLVTR